MNVGVSVGRHDISPMQLPHALGAGLSPQLPQSFGAGLPQPHPRSMAPPGQFGRLSSGLPCDTPDDGARQIKATLTTEIKKQNR